jgi:PAS domain S-box-containing protein
MTRPLTPRDGEETRWSLEISALQILHSLPDAVFTTDRQMRINYFNLAASTMTGIRPHEALSMYCKDVLKSDICELECPIKRALDSRQNLFDIETTLTTASGQRVPILLCASLLIASSGNVVGYMHVFRDISLVKKIMFDLAKSRNKLAERNLELAEALDELKRLQEQLLHAQKMESIGTLAGGIAHDFNNILSGVLGYASLLRNKIDPEDPLYRYVSTIEQSAIKASKLTQQLLTFGRATKYQVRPVNINPALEESLHILERTITRKIQIEKDISPNLWTVEADISQIEQVVLNLCINARDAMPDGGTLTISSKNCYVGDEESRGHVGLEKGNYVKISISDTGTGIPEDIRNRIFDPFFSSKEKGTGLGLSVVYGIVKNHGGFVHVESRLGKGTTFDIFLPMSGRMEEINQTRAESAASGGHETVLLVDDEEMIRDLGQDILNDEGYTVLLAADGVEAVEMYKKHGDKINLIILDMLMPKMDGVETYRRIKEMNPSSKILISSGYMHNNRGYADFREGIDGIVKKPYKTEELTRKVRQILDGGAGPVCLFDNGHGWT